MPDEFIDRKLCSEPVIVAHLGFLQINRHRIVVDLICLLHDLSHLFLEKAHGEEPILRAVIREDVGEGRRDYCAESEVGQGPDGMLARRSATKVPSCYQNARSFVARLVKDESRNLLAVWGEAPIIKQ